jgi:glucose/arabinose dehydrogenase
MRVHSFLLVLLLVLSLTAVLVNAQDATPEAPAEGEEPGLANQIVGSAIITETLPFDEAYMDRLQIQDGFSINIFAQGLGNARMIQVMPDGTVFLTRRAEGDVIALTDEDGDGVADEPYTVVASNLPFMHGIAWNGELLYLATDTHVYVTEWFGGAQIGELREIIDDLLTGGQHPNRTMAFSPEGELFITVGSTCNACAEPDPEAATILRASLDGSTREIYAEGLRNTLGFGWHPQTGELWGLDMGSDWRGDDDPPEELNRIEQGLHYGWPFCWGDRMPDLFLPAEPPGGLGRAAFCEQTEPPVMTYTAHASPIGMVFYTGDQFPDEYVNDAFTAMRGSWNRNPPVGYKVMRIIFDDDGQPVEFQDFVTGWLFDEGLTNFGRLTGVAIAADGSLLIAEDQNGVIYRISYTGE